MKMVLGIDPGLNITGYGVVDFSTGRARLLEAGRVRSRSKDMTSKIKEIYDGVREVIEEFSPNVLALEQLYSHYDRPTTAIIMGHARGVLCLAAAQSGIEVVSYAATRIKKTLTGSGRATKEQVQRAIKLEFGLDKDIESPDVADALAIALCHCYHNRLGMPPTEGIHGVDPVLPEGVRRR